METELARANQPVLGDHQTAGPGMESWLTLAVSASQMRAGCGGRWGGILTAGPCLQVPPWSACPLGSTATCTTPCWCPALCTAPCPSGYSCDEMEPGWARRGTFSEWVPSPGGLMVWAAGEGPRSRSQCPPGHLVTWPGVGEGGPLSSHHCWVITL